MKMLASRRARWLGALVALSLVAGCALLPRSGPNKSEIFAGSVMRNGDAFIVTVNPRVTAATSVQPVLGFTNDFKRAGRIGSDTIRPGDVLSIVILENVENGLFTTAGGLDQVQVDSGGFIFVPYAGRLRASGNTPEQLRQILTNKLDAQTPDPQISVLRAAGDGATVSIVGTAGAQGVFPIERPTRTLLGMIAQAGGVASNPDVTQITVTRGHKSGTVWLSDLYENPDLDIALRPNDRILIEEDSRAYTILGAAGGQGRVEFVAPTLSALEVIAQAGGLNTSLADPTGVFVMRSENEDIANAVLGRTDLTGVQRFVYVLNLTQPNGMFEAREFEVRDGDTVYVTEAPLVQWNKAISAITGTLGTAAGLVSTVAQ